MVKKKKYTLLTDTSDKQSDTSETRDQQTKSSDPVTLDDAFDKEHIETQYRQRKPDFKNTKETLASLHDKRLTQIGIDPEMARFKSKETEREQMLTERATTPRRPGEKTIYETNRPYSSQEKLPINPFQLPPNVTSADLAEYIKHRAQNPFNATGSVEMEKTIPSQGTTTDQELRLNEQIHKHWQDKYTSLRQKQQQQQQQQQLDQTILSFHLKESKLLEKQIKANEKLYKVQLEQDQLKKELDEAKIQLEQVCL